MPNLTLIHNSPPSSAANKVRCVKGEQMYKLTRDELKETFGANNGIRLFSQLQKDKDRVRFICSTNWQEHIIGMSMQLYAVV